ncbi:PDZ domain-containing protein [Alteribacillus sp. HJP-4]|uniref:PDZ domain-containing protein n=1 Tax=Alteribacillus sp. HJP-4 TaxID=2775394 RepID=UPI0035CD2A98
MDVIAWELLAGIGRFFAHPLTYFIPAAMLMLGFFRVKKERATFHTSVFHAVFDLTAPLLPGLGAGLLLSVLLAATGLYISFSFLLLTGTVTLLFLLSGRVRWLGPSHILGLSFILVYFLPNIVTGYPLIDEWFSSLGTGDHRPVLFILAVFIIAEGLLIWKNGSQYTTPIVRKSSRGKKIGGHQLKRIWFVPVCLLIPGGPIEPAGFWPLFPLAETGMSLFIVPFAIGAKYSIFHTLPAQAVKKVGGRVVLLGIFATASAVSALYSPAAGLISAAAILLVREAITLNFRVQERNRPPLFTPRARGLTVLCVLPDSPGSKMGLAPGEIIMKVNASNVNNEKDFYQALQKNSAYCKIEVADINAELRHVQSAVYSNQHHELGVLFVKDQTPLTTSSRQA